MLSTRFIGRLAEKANSTSYVKSPKALKISATSRLFIFHHDVFIQVVYHRISWNHGYKFPYIFVSGNWRNVGPHVCCKIHPRNQLSQSFWFVTLTHHMSYIQNILVQMSCFCHAVALLQLRKKNQTNIVMV